MHSSDFSCSSRSQLSELGNRTTDQPESKGPAAQKKGSLRRILNDEAQVSISTFRNLQDALGELHNLLKQYSPTWYTQEHYERAESALRLANGL